VIITDDDNDRDQDQATSLFIKSFEVLDDDTTPPLLNLNYDGFNYQIIILDNDGIFESYATGEYFLFNEEGIILGSGLLLQENFCYTVIIPFRPGIYSLEIYLTNNDKEWFGDEEFSREIFNINIDIEFYFQYIDKLLEDLINYVESSAFILGDNIIFKLHLAQENLQDAYALVLAGDINCGLFNEIFIQAIIEFVEFETEFYNKINLMAEDIKNVIIASLHEIRDSIVLLMGKSVDFVKEINYGSDIATIEVELLNLKDTIEELDERSTKLLERLTTLAALQLELAIIELSLDVTPDSTLTLARDIINRAKEEVNKLLTNSKISVEIADLLLNMFEYCYISIEEIILEI